jgi:hypothetical protein
MDTRASSLSRVLAASDDVRQRLERLRAEQAARAWEARLVRDLLAPALEGSLPGTAGDIAMTAFAEALAEAGGTGLASVLLKELQGSSPAGSDR